MPSAQKRDPSYGRGHTHPLLYVALGAIFLLVFSGVGNVQIQAVSGLFASPVLSQKGFLSSKLAPIALAPELTLIEKTGVKANTPPITTSPKSLGAILGQLENDIKPEVLLYEVEAGDTISSLAEKFKISQDTILWANDLAKGASLKPGQQLSIPPVSGVLHLVRSYDTLSEIASWYKADVNEIVAFNFLGSASEIFAGDILIVPNGKMPSSLPLSRLTPLPNSYFIWPIPAPHRITQGLHPFNAVDLSNGVCGEAIWAAAGGQVQKTGSTSIGGRYVRILHPNGVVTYYGHLSSILVSPGAKVLQGQLIGYSGRTGRATGCHVHFEVRGAANPFLP
ncbi:MAG: M23 family metallopeptidase [Candidatus Wildermuthbacteria bacterium]|nr:M23 family metallopeptidase [Candidatus Wildermuthbacteria bacterium]